MSAAVCLLAILGCSIGSRCCPGGGAGGGLREGEDWAVPTPPIEPKGRREPTDRLEGTEGR
jgi:hypothetical protein